MNDIITSVLNESISFQNILKNDRFSNQMQYISQKALSICDESEIDGKEIFIIVIHVVILTLLLFQLFFFSIQFVNIII